MPGVKGQRRTCPSPESSLPPHDARKMLALLSSSHGAFEELSLAVFSQHLPRAPAFPGGQDVGGVGKVEPSPLLAWPIDFQGAAFVCSANPFKIIPIF